MTPHRRPLTTDEKVDYLVETMGNVISVLEELASNQEAMAEKLGSVDSRMEKGFADIRKALGEIDQDLAKVLPR